ncbi:PKD domain-containing protein, partial [Bacillus cereus]
NNVVPRKSIISGLSSDPASRYTAERTLFAKYGSWDFYNYSFALQSYLYTHQFETFDKIQDLIRANDVKNYDAYRENLSKDPKLNKEYQEYMQQLIDNQDKYNVPEVADDYLAEHAPKSLTEVKKEISDTLPMKDTKMTKHNSQFFNTFTLEGTYTGSVTKGESEDWKAMSKRVNESLEQLAQKEWSGYKTVTAYFVNYRVNSSNEFEYDVVFHGIAKDDGENKAPTVNINGPYSGLVKEGIQFKSDGSNDEDGKIVSYLWEFGDGSTSAEVNPVHVYEREGSYKVSLRVKDDKGKESRSETTVTIKDGSLTESEPNNRLEEANRIGLNSTIKGSLIGGDHTDVYTFNVASAKDIDISVLNEYGIGMTWVLHHESDMQNYAAYGQANGNHIEAKFNAKPGKYYLYVYKYDNGDGTYKLSVK